MDGEHLVPHVSKEHTTLIIESTPQVASKPEAWALDKDNTKLL
jgi:hypothetical protein